MGLRVWTAFVLSMVPAVLLLVYVRVRVAGGFIGVATGAREVRALVYGAAAALVAWTSFSLLEQAFGLSDLARLGDLPRDMSLVYTFGVVAPVEEGLKLAAAAATGRLVGARTPARAAGALLAMADAALGFSLYENYVFVARTDALLGPRLVTLPLVHLLFGLIAGSALILLPGRSAFGRVLRLLGALAFVSLLHGAYDHVLLDRSLPRGLVAPVLVGLAVLAWLGTRAILSKR